MRSASQGGSIRDELAVDHRTTPFLTWLFHLLRDRKTLKAVATRYQQQYLVHGRSKQTADVQEEIIDLTLSGARDPLGQFRKIAPDTVEKLLFGLLGCNQSWGWVDDLASFWNNPIPRQTFHLDAPVQLRLTGQTLNKESRAPKRR